MPYGRTYSSHAFTGSLTTLFLHQLEACRLAAGETCLCLTDTAWNPAYGAACQSAASALGSDAFQVVLSWDRPVPGPALAAMLNAGEFAPTLNLNVSFHRPAHVGIIKGFGRVVKKGRDVCHLQGELYQDGELIASAVATALIRALPRK